MPQHHDRNVLPGILRGVSIKDLTTFCMYVAMLLYFAKQKDRRLDPLDGSRSPLVVFMDQSNRH